MSDTCEQRARDLLERLSGCTYYDDPQQLSAGDVVELAQMYAEIGRLREDCECYEAMKEGVQVRIADLEAEINRLTRERDVLLACRRGQQRCHECPDIECLDNNAKAGGE